MIVVEHVILDIIVVIDDLVVRDYDYVLWKKVNEIGLQQIDLLVPVLVRTAYCN